MEMCPQCLFEQWQREGKCRTCLQPGHVGGHLRLCRPDPFERFALRQPGSQQFQQARPVPEQDAWLLIRFVRCPIIAAVGIAFKEIGFSFVRTASVKTGVKPGSEDARQIPGAERLWIPRIDTFSSPVVADVGIIFKEKGFTLKRSFAIEAGRYASAKITGEAPGTQWLRKSSVTAVRFPVITGIFTGLEEIGFTGIFASAVKRGIKVARKSQGQFPCPQNRFGSKLGLIGCPVVSEILVAFEKVGFRGVWAAAVEACIDPLTCHNLFSFQVFYSALLVC